MHLKCNAAVMKCWIYSNTLQNARLHFLCVCVCVEGNKENSCRIEPQVPFESLE